MNIRRLQVDELDELLLQYQHLYAEDEHEQDRNALWGFWHESMANRRCRYLGGYEENELVCSCTIMVIPNLARGGRPYGIIDNLVTHAAHRSKGWGKAILNEALDFAWAEKCYKVMLLTQRKDEATLKFYKAAGFDRHTKQAFIAKPTA
jgi:GNAT superfamily N-acetyltransferase